MFLSEHNFIYFVLFAAIFYLILTKLLQSKLIDKKLVKKVQEKSKQLKSSNPEEMLQGQQELMQDMNKMMLSQMKYMLIIVVVFLAFVNFLEYVNPFTKDDFYLNMSKEGDYAYLEYKLDNAKPGMWRIKVEALENNNIVKYKGETFYVDYNESRGLAFNENKGDLNVSLNKYYLHKGDSLKVFASSKNNYTYRVWFDNGTSFYLTLPFTLPILNLKRIYGVKSCFIFLSLVISFLINPFISFISKKFSLNL